MLRIDHQTLPTVFPIGILEENKFLVVPATRFVYLNKLGDIELDGPFEFATDFSEGLAFVQIDKKTCVINTSGEIQFEVDCVRFRPYHEGFAYIETEEGKVNYIDYSGKALLDFEIQSGDPFINNLAAIRIGGKYGFVDKKGRISIQPMFDDVGHNSEGMIPIKQNEKWGFIDESGSITIEAEFEGVGHFSQRLAPAFIGTPDGLLAGYIRRDGSWAISPQYKGAAPFDQKTKIAVVQSLENDKFHIIDTKGDRVGEIEFTAIFPPKPCEPLSGPDWINVRYHSGYFSDGLLCIGQDAGEENAKLPIMTPYSDRMERLEKTKFVDFLGTSVSYLDEKGNTKLHLPFSAGFGFESGLAPVINLSNDDYALRVSYIDSKGNVAFTLENPIDWSSFSDNLVLVQIQEFETETWKKAVSNSDGRISSALTLEDIRPFREGLARYSINEHFGYLDTEGKVAIAARFSDARSFSEAMAIVKDPTLNKYGAIDRLGRWTIPPEYEVLGNFSCGLAYALLHDGTYGFINNRGETVLKSFLGVSEFKENFAEVCVAEGWTFIDTSGTQIANRKFKETKEFSEGLAAVKLIQRKSRFFGKSEIGQWGFIDSSGELVIPTAFDDVLSFRFGICPAKLGNAWGAIDKTGEFIIEPIYSEIEVVSDSIVICNLDGVFTLNAIGEKLITDRTYQMLKFSETEPVAVYLDADGESGILRFYKSTTEV